MTSNAISRFVLIASIMLPFVSANDAVAAKAQDVLVVPARQRTVSMAFDVQAMRDLVLVTYRGTAATETPLMHAWSPAANRWQELAPEAYAIGQFTDAPLGTLFLIGTDRDLPASVIEGASQAADVIRINSMSMAEIANTLNAHLKFSPPEWRALAERHGLKTEDLNYERRKWGRFGPPPSAKPATPPQTDAPKDPEDTAASPNSVDEADAMPTGKTATTTVEAPVEKPTAATPTKETRAEKGKPTETAEPEVEKPFVLDASAGVSLEPETEIKTPEPPVVEEKGVDPKPESAPMIEEKGTADTTLPSINELLPEDK